MTRIRFYIILLFLVLSQALKSFAQDNMGINFLFTTWHIGGDKMAFLQPNKLDKNANIVLIWGAVGHYERFIYKKRFSLKVTSSAYNDCANLFAGHTHLAFRFNFLNSSKHALRFGFGPTIVYRQSWHRFPGYEQQNRYLKSKGDWQYAFVWYGGEIEYDYKINDRLDLNLHAIPGIPDFVTFGVGFRYWLRPAPSNKFWKTNPDANKWFYNANDFKQPKS